MALPVFPSLPGLAFPLPREAEWGDVAQDSLSGKQVRTSNFSYPIYHYEMQFEFLREVGAFGAVSSEWKTLQGFINQLMGGVGAFLYDDPNDDAAVAGPVGIGDGATTTFQLTRTLGGFTEPVFATNVITDVKVSGVSQTLGTDYTLGNYGQITFASPPLGGAPITWDGTFYWVCRLEANQTYSFSNFMSKLYELKKLRFSTLKLP